MASNIEKGFTIEYINAGSKRITCKDCYNFDSSDRSCSKTPRVFPESGYDSCKYCKYFELDRNASYFDEKARKLGINESANSAHALSAAESKIQKTILKSKVKADLNVLHQEDDNTRETITVEEFRNINLYFTEEKLPKETVYKSLTIYLDNGKKKLIDIGLLEGKAYVKANQYPKEYLYEVKRIHKIKKEQRMKGINESITNLIDGIIGGNAKIKTFVASVHSDNPNSEKCNCHLSMEIAGTKDVGLSYVADCEDFSKIGKGIDLYIEYGEKAELSINDPDYRYMNDQIEVLNRLLADSKHYRYFCDDFQKFSRRKVFQRINELNDSGLIKWKKIESEEVDLEFDTAVIETYKAECGDETYVYSSITDLELLEQCKSGEDDYGFGMYAAPNLTVWVGKYYESKMRYLSKEEVATICRPRKGILTYENVLVRTSNKKCTDSDHDLSRIKAKVNIIKRNTLARQEEDIDAYYCSECRRYYILEVDYERLRKIGIICTRVVDLKDISNGGFNNLSTESVLNQIGYNVGKKDNLSTSERRYILNMAIYNKIKSREDIIDFLEWLVRQNCNRSNMKDAINKWNEDIDYLRYGDRPNPEDFIIGTIFKK